MSGPTKALLVMAQSRCKALAVQLQACGIDVQLACGCQDVRRAHQDHPAPDMVLSDLSLDDGSWWIVRQEIFRAGFAVPLIVCLPAVDGGVTDILESGAAAVLTPPYEREKLQRLVQSAVARRSFRSHGATA